MYHSATLTFNLSHNAMPYIVEYDKLIGDNTWLEGINMGFKHEIEAAKYGRELSRSDLNSNIKIYKV